MSHIKFNKLVEYIKENGKSDEFSSRIVVKYLGRGYVLITPNYTESSYLIVDVPSLNGSRTVEKFNDDEYYSLSELLFHISYSIKTELDDELGVEDKEQKVFEEFISNVTEVN